MNDKERLKKFEEIVKEVLNDLQDNETLTIEFAVFENSEFGGDPFEFLSAIFQYGSPPKVDGVCDLCKSTDELLYEDFINVVFEALINTSHHKGTVKVNLGCDLEFCC